MKKFGLAIFSFALAFICLFNTNSTVLASDSPTDYTSTTVFNTYYPSGIEDYVDLNNLQTYAVAEENFYYVLFNNNEYTLNKYNFSSKEHSLIKTYSSTGTQVVSIKWANGKLFVIYGTTLQVYDENNLSEINPAHITWINQEPYAVNYNNEKYTLASITTYSNVHTLHIYEYNNLKESALNHKELQLSYQIKNLAINDNYVYVVGSDGKFHIFDHTLENLSEVSNSANSTPAEAIFNSITGIDAFSMGENHYFGITSSSGFNLYNSNYDDEGYIQSTELNISQASSLDIKVVNKNLLKAYIYDTKNQNIQIINIEYNSDTISLSNPTILLAGKGSVLGRFNNANSIVMKSEKSIFVSDKDNNRIQILTPTEAKQINLGENVFASNLILDENNNLLFLKHTATQTYLSGLIYDNGNYSTPLFEDKLLNNTTKSMAQSLSGSIYLIDYSNNTLKILNSYNENFETVTISNQITLNENSVIKYSNTFAEALVSVDNMIYRVAPQTGAVDQTYVEYDNNVEYFEVDFSNNIYALLSNKIEKRTLGNASASYINLAFDCNTFSINPDNGSVYAFNSGKNCLETAINLEFSEGLTNFPHQLEEIFGNTAYNSVLRYGTINEGTFIYNNVNYVGEFYQVPESNVVNALIIQENVTDSDFIRIGYVLNNQLNIGYVKNDLVSISNQSMVYETHKLRTVNQSVSIFKYPTLANNVVVSTYNFGQAITAIGTYGTNLDDNSYFYVVNVNGKVGYVYSGDVVANTNTSTKLETNAEIRILDHSDIVYLYSEADENSSKILIEEGQRIYVKNYNKGHTFTLISYTDSEHIEHVGYVYTKYIDMDGISSAMITAIILFSITIVLGIAILVFYIIHKKKEASEENKPLQTEKINSNIDENEVDIDENIDNEQTNDITEEE